MGACAGIQPAGTSPTGAVAGGKGPLAGAPCLIKAPIPVFRRFRIDVKRSRLVGFFCGWWGGS